VTTFSEIFHTDPLEPLREYVSQHETEGSPSCLICSHFKLMGHHIYCNQETAWQDARHMKTNAARRYRGVAAKCGDYAGYD
jgi:hypothetical protein